MNDELFESVRTNRILIIIDIILSCIILIFLTYFTIKYFEAVNAIKNFVNELENTFK